MVGVDDPAVRKVPGDVLVLDGLHQTELCDWSVSYRSHYSDKGELANQAAFAGQVDSPLPSNHV